jgi:hypothetical protein
MTITRIRRGVATALVAALAFAGLAVAPANAAPLHDDFGGDGIPDLIARNSTGQLLSYAGTGTGKLKPAVVIGTGWGKLTALVHAGDVDGDSFDDVVVRDMLGGLYLYRGNGAGAWLGSAKLSTGWGKQTLLLVPGDMDGDAIPDLVSRNASGFLYMWPGQAGGTGFGPAVQIGSGWHHFTKVAAVADFSSPGVIDFLATDESGMMWRYPRAVGGSGWGDKRQLRSGWNAWNAIVAAGDLDGDGDADFYARQRTGALYWFPSNGSGTYNSGIRIGSGWNTLVFAY